MAIQLATTIRTGMMDQITSYAGANCTLRIYSGSKPANPAAALAGNTLLAQLACNATFAPGAANGVLTLNAIANDAAADADGTATFFRILKTDGTTVVLQGDCGVSGSDLNLNTVSIVANAIISVTSFVLTAPGA